MKPVNLAFGIWGGLLPGERIALADEQGIEYLVSPFNKGRKVGPRTRAKPTGLPTGGSYGGGSEFDENKNAITAMERKHAVLFAQRIKPYLEV
jgi:hypothetical protein